MSGFAGSDETVSEAGQQLRRKRVALSGTVVNIVVYCPAQQPVLSDGGPYPVFPHAVPIGIYDEHRCPLDLASGPTGAFLDQHVGMTVSESQLPRSPSVPVGSAFGCGELVRVLSLIDSVASPRWRSSSPARRRAA